MRKFVFIFLLASVFLYFGTSKVNAALINTQNSLNRATTGKENALTKKYEQELITEKAKVILYYSTAGAFVLASIGIFIKSVRK